MSSEKIKNNVEEIKQSDILTDSLSDSNDSSDEKETLHLSEENQIPQREKMHSGTIQNIEEEDQRSNTSTSLANPINSSDEKESVHSSQENQTGKF